jgi:hypothetical protein
VVTATRKMAPHKWMCLKFPRVEGLDPVAPTQRIVTDPYNRCCAVNLGHCPLWAPRREGQIEMRMSGYEAV